MGNNLAEESSPYLQQHANNPVHWFPWGDEALEKAKTENKLIIISIGYSACHWCHVMERESFENHAIAETMNKLFVSIKVDREERPDIDQIYMIAVQLMTNSGGWPLNVICLPDGKPVYGGTYFRPNDWQNILLQVAKMWEETPEVAIEYAEKLTQGIARAENLSLEPIPESYSKADLNEIIDPWIRTFDKKNGGYLRSPKFPLPNNWNFFLKYGTLAEDSAILDHVHFTLSKIANGGIYDHVGGGFARYSVDERWHVPHFEKMLYDNAQLLSLYSDAYLDRPNPLYKRIVLETIDWLKRELLAENGGYYCALDADSEGVEGKFYTFSADEFEILGADAELFASYYNISSEGNWPEEKTNVLFVNNSDAEILSTSGMKETEWDGYLEEIKSKLLSYRRNRVRPSLDNKQLVSWNGLLIKGLTDAFRTFQDQKILFMAIDIGDFILRDCMDSNGMLLHLKPDKNREIRGFLDDYACSIEGFISLYEATFDEKWIKSAHNLARKAIELFYDETEKTFYYRADDENSLIARKSEILDNVIPSSTSMIVRQLNRLGVLFDESKWIDIVDQTFANVFPQIKSYGSAYSNWAILLLEKIFGIKEIGILGKEARDWRQEVDKHYIPNKLVFGGIDGSTLPIAEGRVHESTSGYLCVKKTCSLPQQSITSLLELINQ